MSTYDYSGLEDLSTEMLAKYQNVITYDKVPPNTLFQWGGGWEYSCKCVFRKRRTQSVCVEVRDCNVLHKKGLVCKFMGYVQTKLFAFSDAMNRVES